MLFHHPAVEDMSKGSQRHCRSLVPTLCFQWRVHGQPTDQCDGLAILFFSQFVSHVVTLIADVRRQRGSSRRDTQSQHRLRHALCRSVENP